MVPVNQILLLHCNGTSHTTPTDITWLRNNTKLTGARYTISVMQTNNEFNGQLRINSSLSEDTGTYKCNVSNAYTFATSSNVTVVIQG